jgi:hypothetical protein
MSQGNSCTKTRKDLLLQKGIKLNDIFDAKEHVEFLYNHRRYKNKIPTVIDYMEALALPPGEVIKAYNELVTEGKIKGDKK